MALHPTTGLSTRISGESIEDFTRRIKLEEIQSGITEVSQGIQATQEQVQIEGITPTPVPAPTPAPVSTPTPAPPAVGTSAVPRAEEEKRRLDELKQSLGIGDAPTAPDLFTEEDKEKLGITRDEIEGIETELTSILEERLSLTEEFRRFSGQQVGLPEAGRRGAISEEGRNVQDQLDALNRRELVLETKLRNRSNVISELMGLQGQEFADATAQYNKSFSQAIQLYNIFDKEQDELQRNAKANLNVFVNALQAQIQSGGLSFDQITGVQKAKIQELELQAGFPLGVTELMLSIKPEVKTLYTSKGTDAEGNDIVTFIYEDPATPGRPGLTEIVKTGGVAEPPESEITEISIATIQSSATSAKQTDVENFLRASFTDDELKALAKESGFTKGGEGFFGFLGAGVGDEGIQDYLNSPSAREKFAELIEQQYREAGFTITE